MSISGRGTEAEPYLIGSYDDLNEFLEITDDTVSERYYAELTSDIDFKFGDTWDIYQKTYSSSPVTIDLKTHAIKNVVLKPTEDSKIRCLLSLNPQSIVKNGKILNIKAEQSSTANYWAIVLDNGQYENVSVSAYVPELHHSAFQIAALRNCAINVLVDDCFTNKNYYTIFDLATAYYSPEERNIIENCDFKFVIKAVSSRYLRFFWSEVNSRYVTIKNCRITGEIQDLSGSTLERYPRISGDTKLANCVVSFGLPEYTGTGNVLDSWTIPATSTGIVNEDLVDDFQTYMFPTAANMPRMTDTTIRSYSDLIAAGFDVERG